MEKRSCGVFLLSGCLLAAGLTAPATVQAAGCECDELQRRLQQQDERLDRLEEAVHALQPQGEDARQQPPAARSLDDPLVGTWECTNNVFTYHMTFFADGLLLQESTTFGPMREMSWRRVSADEILLPGGIRVRVSQSAANQLTAENLATRAKWECQKLAN